ncbi:MAG: TetR-like C-terminal domain-containing protein [Terracidiphilus sp.]
MLLDAFLYKVDREIVLQAEGPPLERLKGWVQQMGRFFSGENGIVVTRLLAAIQDSPNLRKEFLATIYAPREKEAHAIAEEAIRRGDLPADLGIRVFFDSIVGPLLVRLFLHREEIDDSFVSAVFDQVVAGARARCPAK